MKVVSQQDFIFVVSELECLITKFVALKMHNQWLFQDHQKMIMEKQHDELTRRLQQLESALVALQ